MLGLSLGVPQSMVLRCHVRLPALWAVACVVGWSCALLATGRSITGVADAAALAVIPGVWTGLALAALWKRPEEPAAAAAGG